MNTIFHSAVVVFGKVQTFPRSYGFVEPIGGGSNIRIHVQQLGIIHDVEKEGLIKVEFGGGPFYPNPGHLVALFRSNPSSNHNDYTIAAVWFSFPYYQKRILDLTGETVFCELGVPKVSSEPILQIERKIVAVPSLPLSPPPRRKGEHFSKYREKKRLQAGRKAA